MKVSVLSFVSMEKPRTSKAKKKKKLEIGDVVFSISFFIVAFSSFCVLFFASTSVSVSFSLSSNENYWGFTPEVVGGTMMVRDVTKRKFISLLLQLVSILFYYTNHYYLLLLPFFLILLFLRSLLHLVTTHPFCWQLILPTPFENLSKFRLLLLIYI